LNINLSIGIDFTGSNGIHTKPGTLHYLDANNPDHLNDYQKCLAAVANILIQ
jgi:hypothetical protein